MASMSTDQGGESSGVVYPDDQQDQHTTTSRASAEGHRPLGGECAPNVSHGSREPGGESGVPAAAALTSHTITYQSFGPGLDDWYVTCSCGFGVTSLNKEAAEDTLRWHIGLPSALGGNG